MAVAGTGKLTTATGVAPRSGRLSNGLKEFLWQLDGIGRGHLLDLGPARQTTLNFFIERGFKVYTDDFLTTWKKFLDVEDQKKSAAGLDVERLSEQTPTAIVRIGFWNPRCSIRKEPSMRSSCGTSWIISIRT